MGGKTAVLTLVERSGKARSTKLDALKMRIVRDIVMANADPESEFMTDEAPTRRKMGAEFASHETVSHSKEEYVRGRAHVNSAEGFFSIFKRCMRDIYQHCGEQHLQRYLQEFDFRYSNRSALGIEDAERTTKVLQGAEGKRLRYRRVNSRDAA